MIRYILKRLKRFFINSRWLIQYFKSKLFNLANNRLISLDRDNIRNILILAPHADDEWVGCYSILRAKFRKVTCMYFNLYGDNKTENNIETRNKEIANSAKYNSFKLINNYNYNKSLIVEELCKCDTVFLPSPFDWHEEHRNVFSVFCQTLTNLPDSEHNFRIFYYNVSVPFPRTKTLHCIPQSKPEIYRKWDEFIRIYPSQRNMPGRRYILNQRLYSINGSYAAEVFLEVSIQDIKRDYIIINERHADKLLNAFKQKINNIYLIHKAVNKMHNNE